MTDQAILSPYPIPQALSHIKTPNLGDGIILRAIERRMGVFGPGKVVSPRVSPTSEQRQMLEKAGTVFIGGANQLNDKYSIWPGLTASELTESTLRLIPFGVGLHGEAGKTDSMSDKTKALLRIIHSRIEFSSWRCPDTVAYLHRELPELAGQVLMTGCPVAYDSPILTGSSFHQSQRRIAVTPTERDDFWQRETATIDLVSQTFPKSERLLVIHQNFSPPSRFEPLLRRLLTHQNRHWRDQRARLRAYAVNQGFQIVIPRSADQAMQLYRSIDMHIGSRLHAHLFCLSQNKKSFLTPVDGRATGMAKAYQFPVCTPATLSSRLDMDFEPVRAAIVKTMSTMQRFIDSLEHP